MLEGINPEISEKIGDAMDKLSKELAEKYNVGHADVDNFLFGHLAIPLISNFGTSRVLETLAFVVGICEEVDLKDEEEKSK